MNGSIRLTSLIFGLMVFLFSVGAMYNHQYASAKVAADDYEAVSVAQLSKDLECLALNIYREGGYEPIEGRIAIAQVTLNRVASGDFPNDVCGVVYQKNRVVTKLVCQFSWYCDASHRNRPINTKAYDEAYEVAKKVYLEGFRLDSLTDALYYHADYVRPRWKLERINQIGTHIFYKPKGADHPKLAGSDI
jgi:spore germination cell wall hydrolase CwlJ-like protein